MRFNPELLRRLPRELRIEIAENLGRKDFTPSEMVKIARLLEPRAQALAAERRREGNRRGGEVAGKLPPTSTGDVRDQLAAAVGTSGRTLGKATAVVEAGERNPERFQILGGEFAVDVGGDSLSDFVGR